MSDIRTALESAFLEGLRPGVSNIVKTFETSIRDCLFTGEKLTQGFRPEELPAIAVSAQLKPTKGNAFTTGEEGLVIPFSMSIVTRAANGRVALAKAAEIQDVAAAYIRGLRKSGNALGANAWVTGEIATSATPIDEKPLAFAINTTEFSVLKVVEI